MMNLLIIRERICSFCQQHSRIVFPIFKFLYTLVMYVSWKQLFGYNNELYRWPFMIAAAFVCAFVPLGVLFIFSGVLVTLDLLTLNYEVAVFVAAYYLIVYLLYLRLIPKKSWIIVIAPVLMMKLPALLPILVAMLVGPVGIVPAICGIGIYYISIHAHELEPLLLASADASKVDPLNYLIQSVISDKEMLLFTVVCAMVAMITYLIYQSSMKHAWMIAIITGCILMTVLTLLGSVMIENTIGLSKILLSSLLAAGISIVIQFFRCVVDYSRTEFVQFEDDDYYYYVKAVPKLMVSRRTVNVQKINIRRKK